MIAGIGHSPLRRLLRFICVRLRLFFFLRLTLSLTLYLCEAMSLLILAGLGYDPVGLMSILRGQLAMPLQYFFRGEQLFAIAGAMGRDLGGSRTIDPCLTKMVFDLFAAGA
jgi:hypothetical protein